MNSSDQPLPVTLGEFRDSSSRILVLANTAPQHRSQAHKWVEDNYPEWLHESSSDHIGARILTVTKVGALRPTADVVTSISKGERLSAVAVELASPGCTVFCGNLDWGVKDENGSILQGAFGTSRRIASVKWGMDRRTGKFAGYCHVVFESAIDAKWVVEEMNGAILQERPMKLDFAPDGGRQQDVEAAAGKIEWQAPDQSADNPTAEVRCFVGNLPFSMGTETALREAFSLVGAEVRDVYIPTDR
jgi:RNA recognition motif-containing protein